MSKDKDRQRGRRAIDWIKEQYREGRDFANTPAIAGALTNEHGVKAVFAHRNACAWDRQARYELLAETVYVDPPTAKFGQARSANANPDRREVSLEVRGKYVGTSLSTLAKYQAAAAGQVDATPYEQAQAMAWSLAEQAVQMARKLTEDKRARDEGREQLTLVPVSSGRGRTGA